MDYPSLAILISAVLVLSCEQTGILYTLTNANKRYTPANLVGVMNKRQLKVLHCQKASQNLK